MDNIQKMLTTAISDLIVRASSKEKIADIEKKHDVKIHFVPKQYRIFGGLLQSMNIQFGNFIEKVMEEVVSDNPDNEIVKEFSGKKGNSFKLSFASDKLIDGYITNCQVKNYSEQELITEFEKLDKQIKANELNKNNAFETFQHDIDLLFRNKKTGILYYAEIKYNDDHDSGKFMDINRKLLKTYAYLQREIPNTVIKPILFYFNNKKMKGNIYLPENEIIYRGKRFFDSFAKIKYEDMDRYMKEISESEDTKRLFKELFSRVVK
jgi:hypothetical protein